MLSKEAVHTLLPLESEERVSSTTVSEQKQKSY